MGLPEKVLYLHTSFYLLEGRCSFDTAKKAKQAMLAIGDAANAGVAGGLKMWECGIAGDAGDAGKLVMWECRQCRRCSRWW